MPFMCPHLLQAYLSKSSEILDVYMPQIVSVIIDNQRIAKEIRKRQFIRSADHKVIQSTFSTDSEKIEKMIDLLKIRMWGLESLIAILTQENKECWLANELFQAYIHHLVRKIEALQLQNVCNCIQKMGNPTLLQCSWFLILEKVDTWLQQIGSSLGYFGNPLHPLKTLLEYMRTRLNMESKIQALSHFSMKHEDLDSDEDTLTECKSIADSGFLDREFSTSTASLLDSIHANKKEVGRYDFVPKYWYDEDSTTEEDDEDCHAMGKADVPLEWDEADNEDEESEFYSKLCRDTDFILDFIQMTPSSNPSSSSHGNKKKFHN